VGVVASIGSTAAVSPCGRFVLSVLELASPLGRVGLRLAVWVGITECGSLVIGPYVMRFCLSSHHWRYPTVSVASGNHWRNWW
jgi:hypothetical protein